MKTEEKIKEILESEIKIIPSDLHIAFDAELYEIVGRESAANKISCLIPRWRKVEEELPERSLEIFFVPKKEDDTILRGGFLLGTAEFRDASLNKYYNAEEVLCWMYEQELLNLIPK